MACESVWDLPNNDVEACVRYYERYGVDEDEIRTMFKSQDDPTELHRVSKDWAIRTNAVMGRTFFPETPFPWSKFTPAAGEEDGTTP